MKFLFAISALIFAQASFAQTNLTVLEPLKQLDASATPTPTDPSQQPGQNPGQNPGQHPTPGKGGKGGHGEYDGGSSEYDQIYYTPAYISKMISDNMKIQCYRGLCEMAMVDTRGQAFVAEVTAGYGNQMGMNGMGGSGGVVVVGGAGGFNNTPQPYFGVTLRYVAQHCKQSVRVPTSLYVSMNTYLYNLINEDGTTKRTFDPAEQTMILFYTTILKQANGCTTPTR
jgi:hypothetical protein